LAVEVLSAGNTSAEMERKRREYFDAGVQLVWMIEPRARTVAVFTSPAESRALGVDDVLDGGNVLPGFSLKLRDLFAELDREAGAQK
jgi:Uma2 family endonuclease